MLQQFKVSNFKGFQKELVFALDNPGSYEFSEAAIKDGTIRTCLIYGINGSGKTNLGLALFDIVLNLTDNQKNFNFYKSYLNLDASSTYSEFYYRFKFCGSILEYIYQKDSAQSFLTETVLIDGKEVINYDHKQGKGNVELEGTESLETSLGGKPISFVKYIQSNSALKNTKENSVFEAFYSFVDRMLWFSSLERNSYQGFKAGSESIGKEIITAGKVEEFEQFLRSCDIEYSLFAKEIDGEEYLYVRFDSGAEAGFYTIASQGTKTLALYYYWSLHFQDEVSLVFIDEFDAFYHNKVAETVVRSALASNAQVIITTHNTSIMNNQLLRPDCYFNLQNGKIKSFNELTHKALREAHNLEKMYKAGSFNE